VVEIEITSREAKVLPAIHATVEPKLFEKELGGTKLAPSIVSVNGNAPAVVAGGVKPDDDLWLPYFFWGTSSTTGSSPSYIWRPVTMRNEISAMAKNRPFCPSMIAADIFPE